MCGWNITDLANKPCAALNKDLIDPPPAFDRPATSGDFAGARIYAEEKQLQQACERLLELRGYVRLTAANCVNDQLTPKGYFGHLANPKGNAFLPDLFVFVRPSIRRPLLVELKVRSDYRPGQLRMIEVGMWQEARTIDAFAEILETWEKE